tara:strand:- start:147196 stop:147963 length:768 start_codon:yes stop_codon:yes gene_type:complete
MFKMLFLFPCLIFANSILSEARTIHVFVALADNFSQSIAPVPANLGDGNDASNNLYWGAAYGLKTYFGKKSKDWVLIKKLEGDSLFILERLLFKHRREGVYLLADAYRGNKIKSCIDRFLEASNSKNIDSIYWSNQYLLFGGGSNLVAYCGHNGLMEFTTDAKLSPNGEAAKDVIILACYSRDYFYDEIIDACANPLLWTNKIMAPEAYTLKAAIDGWMAKESPTQIEKRAEKAYAKYQKCGDSWADKTFSSGFD